MRRCILGAAVGAAGVCVSRYVTKRWAPSRWERRSFNGSAVQLTGGLDAACGSVAGAAASFHSLGDAAGIAAGLAGAAAGAVDDHLEARFPAQGKGFHGHIGALREGKITSGLLKIAGIGAGAGVSAVLVAADSRSVRDMSALGTVVDVCVNTLLIAGTANLINLLDLRPGRALKVTAAASLSAAPFSTRRGGVGALLGSSLAILPSDLGGKTMLGDLGANALGGQLGVVLASIPSRTARSAVLGAVLGLTALSEKVSFSAVIEKNPILRAIDECGRPQSNHAVNTRSVDGGLSEVDILNDEHKDSV